MHEDVEAVNLCSHKIYANMCSRCMQKRVILTTLTEIWRSLSREVCASSRAAAAWKDLLGPEPKLLGALFELQEHFFSTAQKWIRKQKIRNEALVFLQVHRSLRNSR